MRVYPEILTESLTPESEEKAVIFIFTCTCDTDHSFGMPDYPDLSLPLNPGTILT